MPTEKVEGWVFDAYPEREGMRVWIIGRDGRRRSVLDPWRPAFHLSGTTAQLKQASLKRISEWGIAETADGIIAGVKAALTS